MLFGTLRLFAFSGLQRASNIDTKPVVRAFVDLAPTSDADKAGIYFDALDYATKNPNVLNIALTGPYGSGKSSVIKSFLEKYKRPALRLSLASFLPDRDVPSVRVTKQEIERSILQQLLYGADANRLPLSRFKRIQTPSPRAGFYSLVATLGLLSAWYLVSKQAELLSGSLLTLEPGNWFNILTAATFVIVAWWSAYTIYVHSLGLSLKSISLKDVEITPNAANSESILNRHLDEIIYFFQRTAYDLVVIEDLDRFDTPDIFVTLREINGLINTNGGIRRRIRFLYALRDDIFVNTDRTKFFEFIVPVIPVINHSNALDKVLEHVARVSLDDRLNRQFVREVSRYLSDLRLIHNIFNEYLMYSANLQNEQDGALDPNKLLAILIYKNVLPRDFAELHRQEGALAKILNGYEGYLATIEGGLNDELKDLEEELALGDAQSLRDQSELRRVYSMAIVEKLPSGVSNLVVEGNQISPAHLAESPALEKILSQTSLVVNNPYSGRSTITIGNVESSVDPTRTFARRAAELERKSAEFKEAVGKRSQELKRQIASLRTRKFNAVIRESAELIDTVFGPITENRELLRFLILEGYIDDSYYQYISLFHEGRLSPSDNQFLIRIRAFSNPPPDYRLDNVTEIVASMRPEDFGYKYVLNVDIIDYLLEDHDGQQAARASAACTYISSSFSECDEFFRSYYRKGKHSAALVTRLVTSWPDFPISVIGSSNAAAHVARLLEHAPEALLKAKPAFARYLSLHTAEVVSEQSSFELERLKSLAVRVDDLPSLAGYKGITAFIVEHGLYDVTLENIRCVLQHKVPLQRIVNLDTRHYSTLLDANETRLLERIDEEFETYLKRVLLALPSNTSEQLPAVTRVLNKEGVDVELQREFLTKQGIVFPSFDGVPIPFHAQLLEERKIARTWENCLAFRLSEAFDSDVLTAFLDEPETVTALSNQAFPVEEEGEALQQFVYENDDLDIRSYRAYVRLLPMRAADFPEVDEQRLRALIEERKVAFTPSTFVMLEDVELRALFASINVETYQADPGSYDQSASFLVKLLNSRMSLAQKFRVINDISLVSTSWNRALAEAIGPILDRALTGSATYPSEFVRSVVSSSRPASLQVSLLNKLHAVLSDADVYELLRVLPPPLADIAAFGKSPKIDYNDVNKLLVSWLRERGLISSFSSGGPGEGIKVNTFKKSPLE